MNKSSEDRLENVHPELAKRVRRVIAAMLALGIVVEVVQGLRTFAEQDALFAQGRTKPGMILTRARGGQSNHNYGLACDLCPFIGSNPDWHAPESTWKAIADEAVKVGLEAGFYWPRFKDRPHVQLPGVSLEECQTIWRRGQGRLELIWGVASRRLKPLQGK